MVADSCAAVCCAVSCHAVLCCAVQVLASSSLQDPTQVDWRTVLPTIVSNMHDYFIAVAAKLERTHTEVRGEVSPGPHVAQCST
jgi:hypothetical protein